MKQWKAVNTDNMEYVGVIEIKGLRDDIHVFEIVKTPSHIVFGSACNIGFLESGNFKIDHDFSFDENLNELIEDLQSYYISGKDQVSDSFSANERM